MLPQDHIDAHTRPGPTLIPEGAVFKVWAPRASAVYLNGDFARAGAFSGASDERLMRKDAEGYWTGFQAHARDGDRYGYFVVGEGSAGYKRDPYARELEPQSYPKSLAVLRDPSSYPWRDAGFRTPDFSDMVIYQAHVGTFATRKKGVSSTFLDVALRVPYLAGLGVNVLQLLPIDEQEINPNMGYSGVDLFSPDFPYVADASRVAALKPEIDAMFAAKGHAPLPPDVLDSASNQLKLLVDACHVHGIAVVFDVVYNHAGGFYGDDHGLYYFDRQKDVGNNNDSAFFTDQDRGTGGLAFAMWKQPVSRFLIDNALWCVEEMHADGLRYDEISTLLSTNQANGWQFCRDVTTALRASRPRVVQNAEFWAGRFADIPGSQQPMIEPAASGGAGFDVVQHDGLRGAVRGLIGAAAAGGSGPLPLKRALDALSAGFDHAWRAVTCIENHDLVLAGRDPRIATLADGSNPRSWYARSRARVAVGLLLTAPGAPQLFMGQEFLEEKPWDPSPDQPLLGWAGFEGADPAMADFQRCVRDLIALRRNFAALRGEALNPFHHDDERRTLAFHRWIEGVGGDVVVVVSLAEYTRRDYPIAFPGPGVWREIFNSDAYDHFPNPWATGNGGAVVADRPGFEGLPASASLVLPANSVLAFAR